VSAWFVKRLGFETINRRSLAQLGSAFALGAKGRQFESDNSDAEMVDVMVGWASSQLVTAPPLHGGLCRVRFSGCLFC
jgi:hypothetical protein